MKQVLSYPQKGLPGENIAADPGLRQEETWVELVRRIFQLAAAAGLVAAGEASGGLDMALGPNAGCSPLGRLGPAVILQALAAGMRSDAPETSIAMLPLVCAQAQEIALSDSRHKPRQSAGLYCC